MAGGTRGNIGLLQSLRQFDPAGAYLLFAAHATAVMLVAALIGRALGSAIAGAAFGQSAAIYMAVAAGVPVMIAQPRTGSRRIGDIAAFGGAIILAGLIGAVDARVAGAGQALLVAGAFLAFYVRRWGDPWAKAGLIGLTVLISHQIIGSLTDPAPLDYLVAPAVLIAGLGWWFTPVSRFDRALALAVAALMTAIARELFTPPDTPAAATASVVRIDRRIDRILELRDHADRFDFARAPAHQARFHAATIAARVWENAADILGNRHEFGSAVSARIDASCRAVAAAIADPSPRARENAETAVAALESEAMRMASIEALTTRDNAGIAALNLVALKLALGHLLDVAEAPATGGGPMR